MNTECLVHGGRDHGASTVVHDGGEHGVPEGAKLGAKSQPKETPALRTYGKAWSYAEWFRGLPHALYGPKRPVCEAVVIFKVYGMMLEKLDRCGEEVGL